MKAKVIKEFKGLPDNEEKPRMIKVDDEIDGDLARVAILEGWADPIGADTEPVKKKSTEIEPADSISSQPAQDLPPPIAKKSKAKSKAKAKPKTKL